MRYFQKHSQYFYTLMVAIEEIGEQFVMQNKYLRATIDSGGYLVDLVDLQTQRQIIPEHSKGNQLIMYEDQVI